MTQYSMGGAARYASVGIQASVDSATPHQLIQLLFDGFLARVKVAKHALARKDYALKGQSVSKAISILGGLKDGLDREKGGELASNLYDLYQYVEFRLMQANAANDEDGMDEVIRLISDISSAWAQIPEHLRASTAIGR
ncbi:MAG: flagellar export chaperone FliS [Pseudomonadota bacterium]